MLFDAVVFDLDGTLVATDRFWLPAAQRGSARAFRELGLAVRAPEPRDWLRIVGLPLARGLELVLPGLTAEQRRVVLARCEEEEAALVRAGGAALMPGARECLAALSAAGVRLAIASNCGRAYLEQVLGALEIGGLFTAARCLESPSVRAAARREGGPKAAMVECLLATLGTRSAVMIGDRAGDREAAHANGLPHVHFSGGFADADEGEGAEAVLDDLAALPALLGRRESALVEIAERAGVADGSLVALSGGAGTDVELFARDLVRVGFACRDVRVVAQADAHAETASAQRPLLVVGQDLAAGSALRVADARIHLVARDDVRRRRLLAARPAPHGPLDHAAVDEDLARPARPAPGGTVTTIETTSALAPRIVGTR